MEIVKEYKILITEDEDGILSVTSINDGFSPFEVLGLITHRQLDILKQIDGDIEPDKIERSVIVDEEGK